MGPCVRLISARYQFSLVLKSTSNGKNQNHKEVFGSMAETTVDATRRLNVKKQTLDDAYAAPANFLEIDVINPITHGVGKKRYTDYEVRMRVSSDIPCCYY